MPITDFVIKKVEEMAVKDGVVNRISFKNRKGVEYVFDNEGSRMSHHLTRTFPLKLPEY